MVLLAYFLNLLMYLFTYFFIYLKSETITAYMYTALLPTTTVFFDVAQNRWYHPTLQSTFIAESSVL